MTTNHSTAHREAIRRTLAHHARGAGNPGTIAHATLTTWRPVAARLAPIIGTGGVDVLFKRSLHLTSVAYPWFAVAAEGWDDAALLASLEACLVDREDKNAVEAAQALLVTFYELLESMLGESLTRRLLGPVWTPESATPCLESTQ